VSTSTADISAKSLQPRRANGCGRRLLLLAEDDRTVVKKCSPPQASRLPLFVVFVSAAEGLVKQRLEKQEIKAAISPVPGGKVGRKARPVPITGSAAGGVNFQRLDARSTRYRRDGTSTFARQGAA
jgi:hypothetical protein